MNQTRVKLILKLLPPDTLPASAIHSGEVPTLNHESLDDTVERDIVVFSGCAETSEVFTSLSFVIDQLCCGGKEEESYLGSLTGEEFDLDISQCGSEKDTLGGWTTWDVRGGGGRRIGWSVGFGTKELLEE